MNILVDDLRTEAMLISDGIIDPTTTMDIIFRRYIDAFQWFEIFHERCSQLFIDHDLGTIKDGYNLMCELEAQNIIPNIVTIVSANPVGVRRISALLEANGFTKNGKSWHRN